MAVLLSRELSAQIFCKIRDILFYEKSQLCNRLSLFKLFFMCLLELLKKKLVITWAYA